MSAADLARYLVRPLADPDPEALAAAERGPIDASEALGLDRLDRLLDPAPLTAENGWCVLPDGVGYVAVRTPMPGVGAEMVDWWFDWHPRDPARYRIWHPVAHRTNSLEPPAHRAAKAHWGAVHHPVEDIGTGVVRARIEFSAPTTIGFSTDALDRPAVATVVCGHVGDDRLRIRHSVMAHVFLRDAEGLILRSRFWLGAAIRPRLPAPLASAAAALLDNRQVRRRSLPARLPAALTRHCAEEYANLATLLPELHPRFGPGSR